MKRDPKIILVLVVPHDLAFNYSGVGSFTRCKEDTFVKTSLARSGQFLSKHPLHHTIERDKKQGGCKAGGPEGPRFRNKQKSVVLTNQHSKFGIVVLDNVVELFRLMQHTRGQSPCISVVPEASNEGP